MKHIGPFLEKKINALKERMSHLTERQMKWHTFGVQAVIFVSFFLFFLFRYLSKN